MKANRDALTPSLETLFTEGKKSNVTDILVRGLIKKAKMSLLPSKEATKYLQMELTGGASLLSLVEDRSWYDQLAEVDGVGVKIAEFAPTTGAEFAGWLLDKAEQEDWDKESVYEHLLKQNREGQISLAHFTDSSVWNKVAEVLGSVKMAEAASYMGAEFADWLLVKTDEENFDNKIVCSGLIKVNKWGKTALAHFADISVWEKVAAEVGADIAKSASAMGPEFTEWLLVKTKEDGWKEFHVYEELIKVNEVGKAALAHCVDKSFWEKATTEVGVDIAQSASAMGPEFTEWLLVKADQEGWNKRQVFEELIKVNRAGKAALAHYADTSFWNKVAAVVSHNVAKSAVAMPLVFTEWVVKKTEEEGWKQWEVYNFLCKATREHQTALSHPMPMPIWTKLSTWAPTEGLHFRVDNKELVEALVTWHTTLSDVGEENEEEADLIRILIEKKGVVVNLFGNGNQLESAVNGWNERNKQLSE